MAGEAVGLRAVTGKIPPAVSLAAAHLAGYYTGMAAGHGTMPAVAAAVAAAFSVGLAAALGLSARARPVLVTLTLGSFFFVGFGRGAFTVEKSGALREQLSGLEEEKVTVTGVVTGFPSVFSQGLRFPFEVSALKGGGRSMRWERMRPRLLVTVRPSAQVHYGDFLNMRGKLAVPTSPRNPGGFNYKDYLSGKSLDATFKAKSYEIRLIDDGYGISLLSRAIGPVRRGISDMVDRYLEGETRSLLRGLLLGDRGLMDPELRNAMAQAGVVHIMAVSGLHVGLVAVILGWGARCARLSIGAAEGVGLVGVWLFCGMVGLPASACRAASMVTAYVICRRLERPAAGFGALAAAGFAMTLAFPAWAKTPGFQLSFSAAAGVLAFKDTVVRYIESLGREPGPGLKGVTTLMGASLGAQITSWPLVAMHFGRTPLLFLVGNAVAVPLVGIVLTWGLMAVVLNLVSATLSGWALASCWAAAALLSAFCRLVGSIPWASAAMPVFSPLLVAVYIVALAAAVSTRGRRRLWAGVALAVTAVLVCFGVPRPSRGGELEVAFLDVGHGDSCVFLAPTGETMLVDAGATMGSWDAGRNVIVPYLRERGARSIDRAVISHGDGDHWGGLAYLAGRVHIRELVLPSAVPLGPMGELVPELEAEGTVVRWVEAGDTLPPLGSLECVVVHPSPRFERLHGGELGDDLNDRSLVLRVTYGNVVFLMTGDVEEVAEKWLVTRPGVAEEDASSRSGGGDLSASPGRDVAGNQSQPAGAYPGLRTLGGRSAPRSTLLDCTVLKVPHHGSDTSSSDEFISRTSPLVGVVSCGPKERFNLPKPQVVERYKAQGISLMMTVRDGAVIVRTDGGRVTVSPYLRPSESFDYRVAAE